jgi:hypothetical protein
MAAKKVKKGGKKKVKKSKGVKVASTPASGGAY